MRYGFVIDQNRCIGCHACTVACKEEHQVPLGVFRTWVKYVEKGEYPNTSRHFGVMRCNHCDAAPCVTICPTKALYRRSDGIIDFDNQRCIGCKSCMQACPYDALYIDPNNNTAAKCNFCAHRVEANLEPACVIVCPTQAILAGDLDDPASKVARAVATQKVCVRKPEKGTEPKLFYVGIEDDLLHPTRLSRQSGYVFAEQRDHRPSEKSFDPALTREVYDVAHPAPWGWKIAAYLWTKSIAAGVMIVAAMLMALAGNSSMRIFSIVSPMIALVALGITMALLVLDLKRPDRFYYLLTKPNFRSWLVIGAYILMGFGAMCVVWLLYGLFKDFVPGVVLVLTTVLAAASACYSAFLFAQAKGRDFWQGKWSFCWHLLVQALVAGAATWVICQAVTNFRMPFGGIQPAHVLVLSLFLSLITLLMEIAIPRGTEDGKRAKKVLLQGELSRRFWLSAVALGLILPITLFLLDPPLAPSIAAVLALYGLLWFEYLWVKAGQSVPLS
ncbi:MAG TPA: 4Fe-4S dicluster domain-containing protein [Candidatus Angelobacter sp.]